MHGFPYHMGNLSVVQKRVGSSASTASRLWIMTGKENTQRNDQAGGRQELRSWRNQTTWSV